MQEYPHGHAALVTILDEYLEPPDIVVIRGPEAEAGNWLRKLSSTYAPQRLVFAIPSSAENLLGALEAR
jgi:uncharacterized protein YyaL (SSP411 family)